MKYLCILSGDVKIDNTVWVGVGRNLMIVSGVWLIQAAKEMLLSMGQVPLIIFFTLSFKGLFALGLRR